MPHTCMRFDAEQISVARPCFTPEQSLRIRSTIITFSAMSLAE